MIILLCLDYKTDNFDDSDLQSRLYAEIYYESNVEDESRSSDKNTTRTIKFDSITELNTEPESIQKSGDKSLRSETAKGKSNKANYKKISEELCNQNTQLSNVTSVIDSLMSDDTLAQNSADSPPLVEFQTNTDELSSRELNTVIHEHDNTNNAGSVGNSSAEEEKKQEGKEVTAKKDKSSSRHRNTKLPAKSKHHESSSDDTASVNETKHSKYNVLSKSMKQEMSVAEQLKKKNESSDSSDSEESIFEIPIPPKPTPPLINLQDSDEENSISSKIDNRISEKVIPTTSHEITDASSSHQDTSLKNKSTDKSLHNKNTTVKLKSTRVPEIREDIVLNCTIAQKSARRIEEIKQAAKIWAELNKNQESNISIEDNTNKNSTQQLPQNIFKENTNFQQDTFVTPEYSNTRTKQTRYNLRSRNKTNKEASCSNSDITIDRKRQYDNRTESPKQKRQCIVQPNNQNVTHQSSEQEKIIEPFQSTPNLMRKYYYDSSRSQENFDVSELQRDMSRDPRLWKILDQDLMPCPSSKQRNRFFNVRCSNCQRDGHQRYDCPVPRRTPCCYICGEKGHVESRCPQKICLTCGKQQNTFRKTCEYCRVLYCTMCHSVGHESLQCPDLWRRYHQTTNTSSLPQNPGNVMKPPNSLHCCNCTKRGHESSTCREYRWSQHFQTPAAVTNYTNGPMYPMSFSDDIYEEEIQSFSGTSGSTNIQQPMKEHSEFATNLDTSPSNARISSEAEGNLESSIVNGMPQPVAKQEMHRPNEIKFGHVMHSYDKFHNKEHSELSTNVDTSPSSARIDSEVEGNLESSSMVNKMPQSIAKWELHRPLELKFAIVMYSYGKFKNKDRENGWIITRDFSLFNNDLSVHGKRTVEHSLMKGKIKPTFLQILFDKGIEFEVKIGQTSKHRNLAVVLQIIALKEYIELIYNLLLHWINIPDNEKDYGLDVTLPMNPTKMFNFFSSRIPQFAKMSFVSYVENLKNIQSDPRWLFNSIKQMKMKLGQNGNKGKTIRKTLWRIQLRLLMIVNTEPTPNAVVSEFYEAIKRLEFQKQNQTIEKLDPTTYLQFTLLFNHLFVPHTPVGVHQTLRRFKRHAEWLSDSLPRTQEIEQNKMGERENLIAIDTQQGTSNETLIDNIAVNENEVMVIEDSVAQSSKDVAPLNAEALNYIEPVTVSMENEAQLSCDDVEYNTIISELNLSAMDTRYFTEKEKLRDLNPKIVYTSSLGAKDLKNFSRKQRKRLRREEIRIEDPQQKISFKEKLLLASEARLYQNASNLIEKARKLKLPYLMSAANELQNKINDKTIEQKHIRAMQKMITSGKKYQKKVNTFWEHLQT